MHNATKDIGNDRPTAAYAHALTEWLTASTSGSQVIIHSDNVGVQVAHHGHYLTMFPTVQNGLYWLTGDSKRSTGKGAQVRVTDLQGIRRAVMLMADRAFRLAKN